MAPEKCSYQILSRNKKTGSKEKMNLILGNTNINEESKQGSKFFGITFDKYLIFDKQWMNYDQNYKADTI